MKRYFFLIFFPTLLFSSVVKSNEEICSKYSNTIWEGEKKVFDDYEVSGKCFIIYWFDNAYNNIICNK